MAGVANFSVLRSLSRFDWLLILAVFILFCFGIATITSVELSRGVNEFVFLRKQLLALGLGLIAFVLAATANYQIFRAYGRLIYWLGLILLIAVLIFGQTFNGTTGWFVFAGMSFQPVEFVKFAMILELARYFNDQARERFGWRELFQSGFKILLPVALVAIQPDWGGAAILAMTGAVMIFFAGIRWQHVLAVGLLGLVLAGSGAIYLTAFGGSEALSGSKRWERFMTYLNPTADPLGEGYNLNQAKIAIGAGGVLGRGLGSGSQSQLRFLPESQTDFVFAVIAEELGFLGVVLVLGAFLLMFIRMLRLAQITRDTFAAFMVIGVMASLALQAFIHVAVNLSIIPATGVTLPLVSSGGSSLVITLLMLGAVESVASRLTPVDRLRTGSTQGLYLKGKTV